MILSTNAFNWAALRSGLSTPDFIATLTHEREVELFKAYNEWRKDKGLPEETMPAPSPTPVALSSIVNDINRFRLQSDRSLV